MTMLLELRPVEKYWSQITANFTVFHTIFCIKPGHSRNPQGATVSKFYKTHFSSLFFYASLILVYNELKHVRFNEKIAALLFILFIQFVKPRITYAFAHGFSTWKRESAVKNVFQ